MIQCLQALCNCDTRHHHCTSHNSHTEDELLSPRQSMLINLKAIIFHWFEAHIYLDLTRYQHYLFIYSSCDFLAFIWVFLNIQYLISIFLGTGIRFWCCLDSFSTIQGITRWLNDITKIFSTPWQSRMASSSMEYETWWGTFLKTLSKTFRGTFLRTFL